MNGQCEFHQRDPNDWSGGNVMALLGGHLWYCACAPCQRRLALRLDACEAVQILADAEASLRAAECVYARSANPENAAKILWLSTASNARASTAIRAVAAILEEERVPAEPTEEATPA